MHCAISWQAAVKKCDLRCKLQPVQRVGRVKSFAKLHRTCAMHCNALGMKLISFLNQLSNSDWHYKLGLQVCWWLTTTNCLTLFRLVTSREESSLDAFCDWQDWSHGVLKSANKHISCTALSGNFGWKPLPKARICWQLPNRVWNQLSNSSLTIGNLQLAWAKWTFR